MPRAKFTIYHPKPFDPKIVDFKCINADALQRLPAIFNRWLPDGEYRGDEYVALNPKRQDRNLGSFSVNTKSGVWCDFATGDSGADIISLVAFLLNIGQLEAARVIKVVVEAYRV
ncbi:MAG: hypothetical protein AAF530_13905 [Pseudomonadota bacterium]